MEKYLAKDGKAFTIRQPTANTAASLVNYSKIVIASTDQIITAPIDFTFKVDEIKALINNLDRNPNSIILIAEIDNQIVGLLIFTPSSKAKTAHTGEFIVNVHPDFQGNGIGSALVETLLNWSHQNSIIEKIFLTVFETNLGAIKLFKDLGFVEEGRHIKAVKQPNGEYIDMLQMFIWVK